MNSYRITMQLMKLTFLIRLHRKLYRFLRFVRTRGSSRTIKQDYKMLALIIHLLETIILPFLM